MARRSSWGPSAPNLLTESHERTSSEWIDTRQRAGKWANDCASGAHATWPSQLRQPTPTNAPRLCDTHARSACWLHARVGQQQTQNQLAILTPRPPNVPKVAAQHLLIVYLPSINHTQVFPPILDSSYHTPPLVSISDSIPPPDGSALHRVIPASLPAPPGNPTYAIPHLSLNAQSGLPCTPLTLSRMPIGSALPACVPHSSNDLSLFGISLSRDLVAPTSKQDSRQLPLLILSLRASSSSLSSAINSSIGIGSPPRRLNTSSTSASVWISQFCHRINLSPLSSSLRRS